MSRTLALLRHGQSTWNLENRFTGWHDCPLSEHGRLEARNAGQMLRRAGLNPDSVHTSVLVRSIDTAEIALSALRGKQAFGRGAAAGADEIEMRKDWRLNERHYGDLTGLNKDETRAKHGKEQVRIWRRSYAVPPPPITEDNPWNPNSDPRYADFNPPLCESLADVTERLLPCFEEVIAPDLRAGKSVLVVAHGNSLRALAFESIWTASATMTYLQSIFLRACRWYIRWMTTCIRHSRKNWLIGIFLERTMQ